MTDIIESIHGKRWLKLDNAAKLFPAIISEDLTSVFRITAFMKEPVRFSALREAVDLTAKRFPYFSVSLGSGIFWHFLEFNHLPPRIQVDEEVPCTAFPLKKKNEPLYRIVVKKNRISVEFIHILTDGGGALEYLKSLLYTYLKICGKQVVADNTVIQPETPLSEEEFEDAYNKFFRKLPPPLKLVKAWHLPFKLNLRPRLNVLHVELNVQDLLEVSRKLKVSVTEYYVSVYHYALQEIYAAGHQHTRKKNRKVLRIEVPVNMRSKFPSRTMRNFSLFVLPEIDLRLGSYTFEEILRSVHHQLQFSSDIKQISRFLSSNVSYEKQLIIRILPLFLKKMAVVAIYRGLASKRFSGMVTNMGQVTLPGDMGEWIESFELIPPPPNPKVKAGSGIISFKDKMRICFSNVSESWDLERRILKHLTDAGIRVKILNNQ